LEIHVDKRIKMVAATLALAAAGMANAQSNVTVYGLLEQQVGRQTQQAPGTQLFDMVGSRLGFKGSESLGGGLTAEFLVEHRFDPQTGTVNGGATFWKGGSWVGLSSDSLGSVKLGRWWSQAYLKSQYPADAFEENTLGEGFYGAVGCGPNFNGNSNARTSSGCLGTFWVNDSVSYDFSLAGFSVGAQVSAKGVGTVGKHPWNIGASYGAGPLYVGIGYEKSNDGSKDNDWASIAATYDFGAAKLFLGYGDGQDAAKVKVKNGTAGVRVPVGAGTLIASYNGQKQDGTDVQQLFSLGYEYKLSKRTKLFVDVATDSKAPASTNKTGYALGVQHGF
jgi:predicted porin